MHDVSYQHTSLLSVSERPRLGENEVRKEKKKILQGNVHQSLKTNDLLDEIIREHDVDILFISKPDVVRKTTDKLVV